jgi:dTDP-glucose 4,6-dehydratase
MGRKNTRKQGIVIMKDILLEKPLYILVTGGAGFIGSNFIPYFLEKYPQYQIINLDKLSYAANLDNLTEVAANPRYQLVKGDICNRGLVEYLFMQYDIGGVIHFAAETHVDNSITGPDVFIKTNVEGTFTVLDVARNHWMDAPGKYRLGYEGCRFHHISTDEVYGSLGEKGLFTEQTPYAPNSPYSASKTSSDLIVRSYFHTYGMNVVTSNCSNNYGPKQHNEKLIPTIIRKALAGETIPVYGDGKNIRDWLYVMDHCKGIDKVYHQGKAGETYNIGGRNERENLYIVRTICRVLDQTQSERLQHYGIKSFEELIGFVTDRPGHDRRYAIDATKIENELGWKAEEDFESGILKTVEWYIHKGQQYIVPPVVKTHC